MPNNKTKQLAQGAMVIAIFAVLIAIAYYIPIISYIAVIIAPLPIAWYSANFNRSSSIFMMIVAILITFFLGGLLILPFSLTFAVMGVVIGDALRNKKSKLYLLISTSIAVLITSTLQYIISLKIFNIDIIKKSMDLLHTSFEEVLKTTQPISVQAPISMEQLNQAFDTFYTVIPAAITLTTIFTSFIVITVNLPLLKRFKVEVPKFAKFKLMRLPKSVLWYYLIILVVTLFVKPEVGTTLYVIILNFSFVFWVLLAIQGVSFIFYILEAYELPNFLKVLTVIFTIPFYSLVLLIGILDLGFNLRTFITEKMKK